VAKDKIARKLTTILAADVAGYSRLMGADEESTARIFKSYRQTIDRLIAKRDGRVFGGAGDSVIAEFTSPVEAVRCAVEFQRDIEKRNAHLEEARRMRFRIGVNLGDVMIEGEDLLGDGVNVAARLEALAEPGGICISATVHDHVVGKLDVAFADFGEKTVKNIKKPVRVYRVVTGANAERAASPHAGANVRHAKSARRLNRWYVPAIAGVAIIVAAFGAWFTIGRDVGPATSATGRMLPVIAVLPFVNRSGDAGQNYFADGVTEELINALGRFNTLRVIGRNAVLSFKKRPATGSDITSKLGASYLVEGSVLLVGSRVRIAVRLTDARAGTVLWTERYDGNLSDIFQFQDAIAQQIAGKLAVNVTQMEGRRRRGQPRPKLDAYDLVLRARAIGYTSTCRTNRQYRELLSKAIKIDPDYALAHALLAEAIFARVVQGCTEFRDSELSRGKTLARRAIALAPSEPDGHRALGRLYLLRADHDRAQIELRRAIGINPSDSYALAVWGQVQLFVGDIAGAIKALESALKYDPALEAVHHFDLSLSYYLARRHADALRIAEQALSRLPDHAALQRVAAAAAARLGRKELARRYVNEIRQRQPFLNVQDLGSRLKIKSHRVYLREGLRLAGL
jgi:class 3 adenylate cyclase/Flp pilus assembly protein TadD